MERVKGRKENNAGSKWTEDKKMVHSENMKGYSRK